MCYFNKMTKISVSKRAQSVDSSGIRRVFDLAAKLENPVNLSIGQPDFDASVEVKKAATKAITDGHNGYTPTQGVEPLREIIRKEHNVSNDHEVFLTAGVSGGLLLSFMSLLDPGDEVLIPDPFFCMYRDLAFMVNAVPKYYDTYPNFILDVEKIEQQITSKTKVIVVNSPSNPTGFAYSQSEIEDVVSLAKKHDLPIIYDEIYSKFCYDQPHADCLKAYDKTILLNGFSKSAGVPGWRAGYVIAPKDLVSQMLKIQQYTLVCTNTVAQWGLQSFFEQDFTPLLDSYKARRDFVVEALSSKFNFVKPGGAFYLFPEAPRGSGLAFVDKCIENNLLVVPGNVFSREDTHFRISFSAPMGQLEKGVEILNSLASQY